MREFGQIILLICFYAYIAIVFFDRVAMVLHMQDKCLMPIQLLFAMFGSGAVVRWSSAKIAKTVHTILLI